MRKTYGSQFAEGCWNDERLSDVLYKMDEPSLSTVLHDYQQGWLRAATCRSSSRMVQPASWGGEFEPPSQHRLPSCPTQRRA